MLSKSLTKSLITNPLNNLNSFNRNKFAQLLRSNKFSISTQIIKAHQNQVSKANPNLLKRYPKTFEEKAIVLNEPKMIQAIEIIEFGVKYKPGKKYLFLFLILISSFTYLHQQILPERIVDGYFAVSTEMSHGFNCGYLLAPFTY